MGEFTQNLLKLTEFPFSYSLMGLLALIFGADITSQESSTKTQESPTSSQELSLAKYGPLLILTGFVATTLSICDPVGVVQRLIIKGRETFWSFSDDTGTTVDNLFNGRIFRRHIAYDLFGARLPYMFAMEYSPEDAKKFTRLPVRQPSSLIDLLIGLKEQAVKTKWITAEIDRITALVYFIIIISLFIVATQLYPAFLQNFSRIFEDVELTKLWILGFSISTLIAVSLMFVLRIRSLLGKAATVFLYLTALTAVKTEKERFKPTLLDIERYLNDNDWTLAEYWAKRLRDEYTDFFCERTGSPKIIDRIPAKDQVNVDVSTSIVAIFNRDMNRLGLRDFEIKREGEGKIAMGGVILEKNKIVQPPLERLDKGTKYTVTLWEFVRDFMGINMGSEETWSFTTRDT
jgi:hypothetical protein